MDPYSLKPHPEDPGILQVWDGTHWHPIANATSRHIRSTHEVFQSRQVDVYEATITVATFDIEKSETPTLFYQDAPEADVDNIERGPAEADTI